MNLGELAKKVEELNNWGINGNAISKDYEFPNFKSAIDFINNVAKIADELNHHPDILNSYNKVRITLTTHSEQSITEKDFEVAKEIDKLD